MTDPNAPPSADSPDLAELGLCIPGDAPCLCGEIDPTDRPCVVCSARLELAKRWFAAGPWLLSQAREAERMRHAPPPATYAEQPGKLLLRLWAIGRSFGYDFDGYEDVADAIFGAAEFAQRRVGEWHSSGDLERERLAADAARKETK